jgi:hypothetical protein
MMAVLPPVARRSLALAILVLIVLAIWTIVIQPFVDSWHQAAENNVQAERLLSAYRDALQNQAGWLDLARKMREGSYGHGFVDGRDANLASAKFQADMKQAIENADAVITSAQVLSPTKDHDIAQLNERVMVSMPLASLSGFLQRIEQRVPYVFIDNLSITAPENSAAGAPVQLTVSCDFHAYLLPEAP